MTDALRKNFTLVFSGNIRDFKMNPLTTETPWGVPHSASMGDALEELDRLRRAFPAASDLLDALLAALPFVEDAEKVEGYAPGFVAKHLRTIRAAILAAKGK